GAGGMLDIMRVRDVNRQGDGLSAVRFNFVDGLPQAIFAAGNQAEMSSAFGKGEGGCAADAGRGAGDDNNLSGRFGEDAHAGIVEPAGAAKALGTRRVLTLKRTLAAHKGGQSEAFVEESNDQSRRRRGAARPNP